MAASSVAVGHHFLLRGPHRRKRAQRQPRGAVLLHAGDHAVDLLEVGAALVRKRRVVLAVGKLRAAVVDLHRVGRPAVLAFQFEPQELRVGNLLGGVGGGVHERQEVVAGAEGLGAAGERAEVLCAGARQRVLVQAGGVEHEGPRLRVDQRRFLRHPTAFGVAGDVDDGGRRCGAVFQRWFSGGTAIPFDFKNSQTLTL